MPEAIPTNNETAEAVRRDHGETPTMRNKFLLFTRMDLSSALWPGKICAATASPITQTLFPVVLCLSAGNPANSQEIDMPICIPMRSAARFKYTIWEKCE
jgi:hypothetical protein